MTDRERKEKASEQKRSVRKVVAIQKRGGADLRA